MRFAWAAVGLALTLGASSPSGIGEPGETQLREQRSVVVDGRAETWRLVWAGTPRPACAADEVEVSLTCPCSGWAYGEAGKLELVRSRLGRDVSRLDLGPLFINPFDHPTKEGEAALQLRPPAEADWTRANRADPHLIAEIGARPKTQVMRFADYNHDGAASEFLIQVATMPCEKRLFAAVGVSRSNSRLHAFGSAAHPDRPLLMPMSAWEALRRSSEPTTVTYWQCDDHGSEFESRLTVSAAGGRIRAVDRGYGCESAGTAGRLMRQTEW